MAKKKFWIFSDPYCFVGFFSQIFYILTPIVFIIQLKSGVLHQERVSIFSLLSLYCNGVIYFATSVYKRESGKNIDPLDFCNLGTFYLGLIYLLLYIYFIYFNIWDKIFSWIGVFFNVTEYFPLGFNIIYFIKNKISEKYTLLGAFFGLFNCVAWLCWAINGIVVNNDNLYHSIVANSLGICLQITQFTLFFLFRRNNSKYNPIIEEKIENSSDGDIDIDIGNSEEDSKDPEYMDNYI
jgi:hypothetical protein